MPRRVRKWCPRGVNARVQRQAMEQAVGFVEGPTFAPLDVNRIKHPGDEYVSNNAQWPERTSKTGRFNSDTQRMHSFAEPESPEPHRYAHDFADTLSVLGVKPIHPFRPPGLLFQHGIHLDSASAQVAGR